MNNRTPSIAIIVEAYGEWGDSDREVVKRIERANIAIDHDVDQAVAIERNMTATWLDKLGDDEMWADIATRYHLAAEAVRNGEHHKEEA